VRIVALGVAVTCLVFVLIWVTEYRKVAEQVRANTELYGQTISANLNHYDDVVLELRRFLDHAGGTAHPQNFETFARSLISQHDGIMGLLWVPRVTNAARPAFEAGFGEANWRIEITERAEGGEWRRAAPRDEYFPITFLTELSGDTSLVGYDLGSEPERRRALETARDTGEPAVTRQIPLMRDGSTGLLMFAPIYRDGAPKSSVEERRAAITGFAVGAIQLSTALEETIRATRSRGFDIYFVGGSASTGYQLLYAHPSRLRAAGEALPDWEGLIDDADVDVGRHAIRFVDQNWTMIVRAIPAAYALSPPPVSWVVLALGFLATGLAGRLTQEAVVRSRLRGRQDTVTGLINRSTFVQQIRLAADPDSKHFAVLYLNLDHFKDVNNAFGRAAGDQMLRAVAERLRAIVREEDSVARFGGDEFAILQTGVSDPAEAVALADKVLKALGRPFPVGESEVRINASIGIAINSPDATDPETILSRSDMAVLRAKSDGRGAYRFFTEALDKEMRGRIVLGAELAEAIASGQLFLVYQPQVDIDSGHILGVEALVRWQHPERGLVMPGAFIPVAESNGLIVPLGRWVLREACRQMKAWLDAGIAPRMVGVNVSGLQFRVPSELENDVAAVLAETALPAERLELEFTESMLMELDREHEQALHRLRNTGLRIAIDDFGTGYSSLEYLSRIPVNRLKIGQTFIANLASKSKSAKIVKAAIGMTHELGLDVVVEGIETAEQLKLVRSFDGHKVQGYYFSKPVAAEQAAALLRMKKIIPAKAPAIRFPDEMCMV